MNKTIRYLNQKEALLVDQILMGTKYGFSVDQLMELAGVSIACSIQKVYPHNRNVLTIVGPGNNGGDGLVCSRHLSLFGYNVDILYPKRTDKDLYKNLLLQCEGSGVKIIDELPSLEVLEKRYNLVIDSIFGFSFKGEIRAPFNTIIQTLSKLNGNQTPIVSVDIPSGWDVEKGKEGLSNLFDPQMLVSLSAPKMCAQHFNGIHYLGGRFIPKDFELELNLPDYPGSDFYVDITSPKFYQPKSSL
eukprot:gene558-703_t